MLGPYLGADVMEPALRGREGFVTLVSPAPVRECGDKLRVGDPKAEFICGCDRSCWRLSGGIWPCSWPTLVPHPTPTSSSSGTVSDSVILSDTCSVVEKSKAQKLFHPGIFHCHMGCVFTGVDTSLVTGILFAFFSIIIIPLLNTHTYAQSISFTFSAPLPSYNLFFSLSLSLSLSVCTCNT